MMRSDRDQWLNYFIQNRKDISLLSNDMYSVRRSIEVAFWKRKRKKWLWFMETQCASIGVQLTHFKIYLIAIKFKKYSQL